MLAELFPGHRSAPVREAIESLAAAGATERGAVFTRPEVVRLLLDLAGYDPARPLHEVRLLEPSFGAGDFLLPVLEHLYGAAALVLSRADRGAADGQYRSLSDATSLRNLGTEFGARALAAASCP